MIIGEDRVENGKEKSIRSYKMAGAKKCKERAEVFRASKLFTDGL